MKMKRLGRLLAVVGVCGIVASATAQDKIWDYGHDAGTTNGCWANRTESQNFAEPVKFDEAVTVTGMTIYSCIAQKEVTVHIKVLADDSGNPGELLHTRDVTPSSWEPDETGENLIRADFDPIELEADTIYWIGMSGNGSELGQHALRPGPDDDRMAQFSGANFQGHTGVGDQKFDLWGNAGGDKCTYTLKKSKAKGGCETCPKKGSEFKSEQGCEVKGDCKKRVKTTISCPEGKGKCKLKAKKRQCG